MSDPGGVGLPGPGGCLPGLGGVCMVRGVVSAWSRGGCLPGPGGGGCLPGPGGVSEWSGGLVSAWSQGGVCLVPRGGCLVLGERGLVMGGLSAWSWGSGIPACTEADTLPPVNRMNDRHL